MFGQGKCKKFCIFVVIGWKMKCFGDFILDFI